MGILDGKRILVTGVLTESSIAFHVARIAQQEGATVVLTGYGRLSLVERIARRLPDPPPVLELDVTDAGQLDSLADRVSEHVDGLDGVVHGIGNAPQSAMGGNFLAHAVGRRGRRAACVHLLTEGAGDGGAAADATPGERSSGWTSTQAGLGPPMTGWASPRRASNRCARYLARDLGPRGIRVNLIAAGPLQHHGGQAIPGFEQRSKRCGPSARRSAGTSANPGPAARACVALLSDWFPATTGEIVHADGGVHAVGG